MKLRLVGHRLPVRASANQPPRQRKHWLLFTQSSRSRFLPLPLGALSAACGSSPGLRVPLAEFQDKESHGVAVIRPHLAYDAPREKGFQK